MKVIYNKLIPFKGFLAINLFGILFVRKEHRNDLDKFVMNHEAIHSAQMKELGYVFFYVLYFFEWVFKLFKYRFDSNTAYSYISFEKEAYSHEYDLEYLGRRRHYAQWGCREKIDH